MAISRQKRMLQWSPIRFKALLSLRARTAQVRRIVATESWSPRIHATFPIFLTVAEASESESSRFVGIMHDISGRKKAQKRIRALHEELLQAKDLASAIRKASALAQALDQPEPAVVNYVSVQPFLSGPSNAETLEKRQTPTSSSIGDEMTGIVCNFKRDGRLFREGDNMAALYKIVSGIVRLYRTSFDGRRQIVDYRFPNDIVGLELDEEYHMTGEAVDEVVAVRYIRSRFDSASKGRPGASDAMLAQLRNHLLRAQDHLLMVG